MKLACYFKGHDWKRIGRPLAVEIGEWNENVRMRAYGECRRCGKREPQLIYGEFSYSVTYTKAEAIAEWEREQELWGEDDD